MATSFCPHCHQRLPLVVREGVKLTGLKAKIFDCIKRAGASGIPTEAINMKCFGGDSTLANIRVHVHQINEALEDSGVHIRSYLRAYQLMRSRHG